MLQISYADMLTKVDPLRNELKSLEIEAQASRIKVRNGCFYSTKGEHFRSGDFMYVPLEGPCFPCHIYARSVSVL